MIQLVLAIMWGHGLAFVLGRSAISFPLRKVLLGLAQTRDSFVARWFLKWLECPGCIGCWFGVVLSLMPAFRTWFGLSPTEAAWLLPFAFGGSNILLAHVGGLDDD